MKDSEWPSLDHSSGHEAKLRICNRPQDWGAREQVHTVSSWRGEERRGGRMGPWMVLGRPLWSTASPVPTQTSVQGMGCPNRFISHQAGKVARREGQLASESCGVECHGGFDGV